MRSKTCAKTAKDYNFVSVFQSVFIKSRLEHTCVHDKGTCAHSPYWIIFSHFAFYNHAAHTNTILNASQSLFRYPQERDH